LGEYWPFTTKPNGAFGGREGGGGGGKGRATMWRK